MSLCFLAGKHLEWISCIPGHRPQAGNMEGGGSQAKRVGVTRNDGVSPKKRYVGALSTGEAGRDLGAKGILIILCLFNTGTLHIYASYVTVKN